MGLKKKQRTANWYQRQVDQEVASRVDEVLKNIKKKKEKSNEEESNVKT